MSKDPRWQTPKKTKYKPKPKPEVEICRVLPFRLAHTPDIIDWLTRRPKTRLDNMIGFELDKLYRELAELIKNKNSIAF